MGKKAKIEIDTAGGLLTVDGTLYLGETVDIEFVGVTSNPRIVLFDDDGVTSLADNSTNPLVLDLRGSALRVRFAGRKCAKSFRAMAFGGDDDVYANGMVSVKWSPVVYDEAHMPATLKGPKGDKGDKGDVGPMGPLTQVKDPDTGKWYNVYARLDSDGNRVLSMDQSNSDPIANGSSFATKTEMTAAEGRIEEVEEICESLGSRSSALEGRASALEEEASKIEDIEEDVDELKDTADKSVKLTVDDQGKKTLGDGGIDEIKGSLFAKACMPDISSAIDITDIRLMSGIQYRLYFSGGNQIAQKSGYMCASKTISSAYGRISLRVTSPAGNVCFYGVDSTTYTSGNKVYASVPVPKGCAVELEQTGGTDLSVIFYPCISEVS